MALKTDRCCCCTTCERLDKTTCCECVCRRIVARWTKPSDITFPCDGLSIDCRTCLLWDTDYHVYEGDMECCGADCGAIDISIRYGTVEGGACKLLLTSVALGVEDLPNDTGTTCGEVLGATWSNLLPEDCGGFCDLYVVCECVRCCDRGVPLFYDQCESGNCLDRLPSTLTATITDVNDCTCFEMSFSLIWDETLKDLTWKQDGYPTKLMGTCPQGSPGPMYNTIGLILSCSATEWTLLVDSCGASPTDTFTIAHGSANETCLPLQLVFDNIPLTACCQPIGNQGNEYVRITITE